MKKIMLLAVLSIAALQAAVASAAEQPAAHQDGAAFLDQIKQVIGAKEVAANQAPQEVQDVRPVVDPTQELEGAEDFEFDESMISATPDQLEQDEFAEQADDLSSFVTEPYANLGSE